MPLSHVELPGLEDIQEVHFPMMNENMSVRVVVAREAILRGGLSRGESILARFEFDRTFYEVLASEKFDRAQPKRQGLQFQSMSYWDDCGRRSLIDSFHR